jgi:hypothetical protein
MTRTPLRFVLAVAALAAVACRDQITSPESRDESELKLLHTTYDYPGLVTPTATFWAVKGRATGVDLWYHPRPGASDSARFVEFRVGANALDRRADGSTIAAGDSVQITVTANDAHHMMIQFQPSGLRFASTDQPTLKMFWVACGDDLNYDGKVDASDDEIVSQLNIWRQETPGARWQRIASAVVKPNKEVNAKLSGFTGYAISY